MRDTRTKHRIHIIEFSGTVNAYGPIMVEYDPLQTQDPRSALQSIKRRLVPNAPQDNETDTLQALQAASAAVSSIPHAAPDNTHVILVTDGKPYVEGSGGTQVDPRSYRRRLEQVSARLCGSASFHVLGIVRSDYPSKYWPEWGSFWSRVANGGANAIRDASDVSLKVDDILQGFGAVGTLSAVSDPYYCPPYLRSITFTVYKDGAHGPADIQDALGRKVTPGMPGVRFTRQPTYDRITVEQPVPGRWDLDKSAVEIKVELFYQRVRRLQPRGVANIRVPLTFRYQVAASEPNGPGGQEQAVPFQELPQFPVNVDLSITEQDGQQVSLSLRSEGKGIYAAPHAYELSADGEAALQVSGTTVLPDGSTVEVFGCAEKLQVSSKDLLVVDTGGTLPSRLGLRFGSAKLPLRLSMLSCDDSSSSVPLRDLTATPDRLLEVRLVDIKGQPLEGWDWQWLNQAGDRHLIKDGKLEVSLPSLTRLVRRPMRLYLECRVKRSALADRYAIRELRRGPNELPAPSQHAGALPTLSDNPMALPLTAREEISTWLAATALALFIVLVVGWLAYRLTRWLFVLIGDNVRGRTIFVEIQTLDGELAGARRGLRCRTGFTFRRPGAVGIRIEDDNGGAWEPGWFYIRRLVRPWSRKVVVRLSYPGPVLSGKARKHQTVLEDGGGPRRLDGVANAQAVLEVRQRGKSTSDDFGGGDDD